MDEKLGRLAWELASEIEKVIEKFEEQYKDSEFNLGVVTSLAITKVIRDGKCCWTCGT